MSKTSSIRGFRAGWLVALVVALTACGGGGSGGGSAGEQVFTLDRTELRFASSGAATVGPSGTLIGRISGSPDSVYLFIQYTRGTIQSVSQPVISGSSGISTVTMVPGASVVPGRYRETITVLACRDFSCLQQFSGSPRTVDVHYDVGMAVDPASMRIEGFEGVPTATQALSFSHYAGSVPWTASPIYATPGNDFLRLTPRTGASTPASLQVGAGPLPTGNHMATVRLSASGEVRDVPVEFEIRSSIGIEGTQLIIDDAAAQAPITFDIGIVSRDPSRQFDWTATVEDLPWATVVRGRGRSGVDAGLTLRILPEAIRALPNRGYFGNLRVRSTTPGFTEATALLNVLLLRAYVGTVAPYAEAAGYRGRLLITGDQLPETPIDRVLFGDVPATVASRRNGPGSTFELGVDTPLLPAGRYPVSVEFGGLRSQGRGELVLVNPDDYAAAGATAPLPAARTRFLQVFDAARRAVYSLPSGGPEYVYAARFNGVAWVPSRSSTTFLGCASAALTIGGDSLVGMCSLSGGTRFVDIDPETLELRGDAGANGGSTLYPQGLVAASNGYMWVGGESGAAVYRPPTNNGSGSLDHPVFTLAASRSGNAFLSYRAITENAPMHRIDPFTFTSTLFLSSYPLSLQDVRSDRFGTRWAMVGTVSHGARVIAVYDGTGTFLGQVDYRPSGGSYLDAFVDPDGTRLYVLGASQPPLINGGMAVYDLRQPSAGSFALLGTSPLSAVGGRFVGITPDGTQVLTTDDNQVQASRIVLTPP